jgi:hypothetical protein
MKVIEVFIHKGKPFKVVGIPDEETKVIVWDCDSVTDPNAKVQYDFNFKKEEEECINYGEE